MHLLPLVSLLAFVAFGAAQESCKDQYDMLGCYEEYSPGVPLVNHRSKITWNDIEGFMRRLACECSKIAKSQGYAGFALHYWGECYGRTAAEIEELTKKSHNTHKCVGSQAYTHCDQRSHEHCTGMDYAEGVYKFKTSAEKNVDGGLGEWGSWTTCSKTCGDGIQLRERNCDNPLPEGKGKDCSELGPLTGMKSCKVKECPVNGGWSSYGSWGSCSKSCGGGVKYRHRQCNNPAPAHGGASCTGSPSLSTSCNTNACPVNGGWSSYGSYGSCSKNCGGGTQTRTRTCTNPSPKNGGSHCSGSSHQSRSCNTDTCPVINSCATKYTSYQTHSGGNMVYIDRHRMNCGGSGNILSMFHLQRSGGNMRYQYTCCKIQGSPCSNSLKTTSFDKDGGGDAVYLDRHTADCGTKGFINDIRVERNSGHNKIRYSYYCCNLNSKWSGRSTCYSSSTSFTYDGNGKVYYLDRQTVKCNSGYALSRIKLERNSGHNKWRYNYRCCKVNY